MSLFKDQLFTWSRSTLTQPPMTRLSKMWVSHLLISLEQLEAQWDSLLGSLSSVLWSILISAVLPASLMPLFWFSATNLRREGLSTGLCCAQLVGVAKYALSPFCTVFLLFAQLMYCLFGISVYLSSTSDTYNCPWRAIPNCDYFCTGAQRCQPDISTGRRRESKSESDFCLIPALTSQAKPCHPHFLWKYIIWSTCFNTRHIYLMV